MNPWLPQNTRLLKGRGEQILHPAIKGRNSYLSLMTWWWQHLDNFPTELPFFIVFLGILDCSFANERKQTDGNDFFSFIIALPTLYNFLQFLKTYFNIQVSKTSTTCLVLSLLQRLTDSPLMSHGALNEYHIYIYDIIDIL